MDASRAQIQKAYFELARQVHPDRLRRQNLADLVDDSTAVFKVLSDAYNLLINPEQRASYVEQMGMHVAATGEVMGDKSDLAEMAKIFHHKGMLLLKRKDYPHAEKFFRKAYEADGENAVYALRLGWSVLNNEERDEKERTREARVLLTEAVEKDDKNAEAHYHLALFYKETENVKMCRDHLQLAIKCRDHFIEAKRELRLLEMRKRRKEEGTDDVVKPRFSLSRLFGKKD